MPDIDLSKLVSVPEMYRFVRNEVPLGRALAPVVAWLLIGAVMVWSGGVVWRGVGLPVIQIAKGGISQVPSGQIGPTALAIILFLIAGWFIHRLTKRLDLSFEIHRDHIQVERSSLELHKSSTELHKDMTTAVQDFSHLWQEGFKGYGDIIKNLIERLEKVESQLSK